MTRNADAFALFMEMRCVDGDTEYLSPSGWRRMVDYDGGQVAEFRLDGTAHFVQPVNIIIAPVDKLWHFHTQGGVDQVLSDKHRILLCSQEHAEFGKCVGVVPPGYRSQERACTTHWRETSPMELATLQRACKDHVPTSFVLKNATKLMLTDDEIRLMVAFHADGSISYKDKGRVRVKRERKKARMRELLQAAGVDWKERPATDPTCSVFSFRPPMVTKQYSAEWWLANEAQRRIICDEACLWGGSIDGVTCMHRWNGTREYHSRHESDVDFIQHCYASTGHRAIKRSAPAREGKCSAQFTVTVVGAGRANNLALLPAPHEFQGEHDGLMYSFEVPSSYLVLRRNGLVFVTGNCGKSRVILDEFGELELAGTLNQLLIIAPAGVYRTWEAEAAKQLSADLLKRVKIHRWESGPDVAAKKAVNAFLAADGCPKILLVNVEAISSTEVAQKLCVLFMKPKEKLIPTMLVIDESVIIKSRTAKRTRFCLKLADIAARRRILSGLPSPQSPMDLFTQFAFLDPGILDMTYAEYQAHYAIVTMKPFGPGKRMLPIITGYKNTDDLQRRIAKHSYRVRLAECTDLPPKLYMRRDIAMTPEQAHHYTQMREFATTLLNGTERVTATIVLTQMLRLHQILSGHAKSDDGEVMRIPENKTGEVLSILDEHSGKAIIWVAYDADVNKLATKLAEQHGPGAVARFWGGNADTRDDEEQEFKTSPKCRFMIATAASGGRGRTWSVADLMIYYANTFSLEHRLQSEERASGIGKTINVCCVDLVVRGSIEDKILDALRNKKDLSDAVMGDAAWRGWLSDD